VHKTFTKLICGTGNQLLEYKLDETKYQVFDEENDWAKFPNKDKDRWKIVNGWRNRGNKAMTEALLILGVGGVQTCGHLLHLKFFIRTPWPTKFHSCSCFIRLSFRVGYRMLVYIAIVY